MLKKIFRVIRLFQILSLLLLICLASQSWAYSPHALKIGVLPSESAVKMFHRLAPLREYLSLHLNQKVYLETAHDYQQFIERSDKGYYDILLTAPHLALLAYDSGKYDLVASFYRPLCTVFVVKMDSHIKSLDQVAGMRLAAPPEEAIVSMVGREMLKKKVDLKSLNFQYYRSHGSAFQALRAGDADVAVVANLIYRINRNRFPMRVIASSHEFPGIGVLVRKELPDAFKSRLSDVLTHMRASTDGLVVLKKISQPGYSAATIKQFEVLRKYLKLM